MKRRSVHIKSQGTSWIVWTEEKPSNDTELKEYLDSKAFANGTVTSDHKLWLWPGQDRLRALLFIRNRCENITLHDRKIEKEWRNAELYLSGE